MSQNSIINIKKGNNHCGAASRATLFNIICFQFIFNALIRTGVKTSAKVTTITDVVIECNLISLFTKIYSKCFHLDWSGPDGTDNVTSTYLVAGAMWNATDRSKVLCENVVDTGLSRNLLKYLNDPKVHPDRLNATGIRICVRPLLSILHNVVQVGSYDHLF